jgi:ketosteroid isomerase-like protein
MTKAEMIARATAYFADVDRFDTGAIMAHFAPDAVMEVPSHATVNHGHDAIRAVYERRASAVKSSWHGNFVFMADEAARRLAIRLSVKRTLVDGTSEATDNVTIIEFAPSASGGRIARLSAWLPGRNTLS